MVADWVVPKDLLTDETLDETRVAMSVEQKVVSMDETMAVWMELSLVLS